MQKDILLKKFTTMHVGGKAAYFVSVESEEALSEAVEFALGHKLAWYVIGEGSNIIPADSGFDGLIIKNNFSEFKQDNALVRVGAGNNLLDFITKLNSLGLKGLEKMAGIPGSVGGAVYGSAGAYGQEIKDKVRGVRVYDVAKREFKDLNQKQCEFSYRGSIFKENKNLIIVGITLEFEAGESSELQKSSEEIIQLREEKYKPGLKCPGSFFKNVKLDELTKEDQEQLVSKIDPEKVMYGKVPAWYLLEEVGAKGMEEGSIRVADHHANLIYNPNGGTATDIVNLAKKLKQLVKEKFGIELEEEVQYL